MNDSLDDKFEPSQAARDKRSRLLKVGQLVTVLISLWVNLVVGVDAVSEGFRSTLGGTSSTLPWLLLALSIGITCGVLWLTLRSARVPRRRGRLTLLGIGLVFVQWLLLLAL